MTVHISEKDAAFIKESHRRFAEQGTLCRCGGRLKIITYQCDALGATDIVEADGEKVRRGLKVCEDCGAVYAIPAIIERGV